MSEQNQNQWPFAEAAAGENIDINAIFGTGTPSTDVNPFETPAQQPAGTPIVEQPIQIPVQTPVTTPVAAETPASAVVPTEPQQPIQQTEPEPVAPNLIAAAFEQKAVENAQVGLLEKPPVFSHKNAKDPIEDATITFEDLRILKCEDFTDLEDGKNVSWSVEYCGIRREIKDPKGTTIISVKQEIEQSKEFLTALKKAKDKNQECIVKPKVVSQRKGTAAYRGWFRSVEDARKSDKVICLIPSGNGQIYEMRKTEQGEFIAPKHNVKEYEDIRAGFTPALPKIPMALLKQVITFFRSYMSEYEEYEAMAQIYWDKEKYEFFAYVPKQLVTVDGVNADLRKCPYDDESRYILYADIHSHNSMDAFFSVTDDRDEKDSRLYMVVGHLEEFFPDIKARFFCGGTHVPIHPAEIVEDLWTEFPLEWANNVVTVNKKVAHHKSILQEFAERMSS